MVDLVAVVVLKVNLMQLAGAGAEDLVVVVVANLRIANLTEQEEAVPTTQAPTKTIVLGQMRVMGK